MRFEALPSHCQRWLVCFMALLAACASAPDAAPEGWKGSYLDRAQTEEKRWHSGDGSRAQRGRRARSCSEHHLYRRGVQPVWLKIENHSWTNFVSFLPVGLDPGVLYAD